VKTFPDNAPAWTVREGWLRGQGIRYVPSPNCDPRPPGEEISLLVIHNISLPPGEYGGCHVDALFNNCLDPATHPYFAEIAALKVSAHVLIDRHGALTQYVPFHLRAWHAGVSVHQGRERCNDFSIGIELEGCDDQPYDDRQYEALRALTAVLLLEYPALNRDNIADHIVGHCHIAPGRKTDPGPAFDWPRYFHSLFLQEMVT
jgi:AmpD protein